MSKLRQLKRLILAIEENNSKIEKSFHTNEHLIHANESLREEFRKLLDEMIKENDAIVE